MRPSLLLAAPVALFWAAAAWAAPATEAGAARLTALFQTYIGTTEGMLALRPDGEAYEVTLDLSPLSRAMPEGAAFAATPLVLRLTDQGDGSWAVAMDQGVALTVSDKGKVDLALTMGKVQFTGVFDEALQAFRQSRSDLADFDLQNIMTDPQGTVTRRHVTVSRMSYEGRSVPAAAGAGVDSTITVGMTDWRDETGVTTPEGVPEPGGDVVLSAETYAASTTVTGLRTKALYRILAYFVAHPSKAALVADQPAMKAVLRSGLPIFDVVQQKGTARNVVLETIFGPITISEVALDGRLNGLVKEGLLRQKMVLSGWGVPESLAPAWAQDLVPGSLAFDVQVSGFDWQTPLLQMIDAVDLADPDSLEAESQGMMAALLPQGVVNLSFAQWHLRSGLYDIGFEGKMALAPEERVQASGRVQARGLEAVREAVGKAPAEVRREILPMLAIMQALAVNGPEGALVWELEAGPNGATVNGKPLPGSGP